MKDKQISLPEYLRILPEGVFVDVSLFPLEGGFVDFIDNMFGEGARFYGLDYHFLSGLLYDHDAILAVYGTGKKVQIAEGITDFSIERKTLYKAVKVDREGKQAEYLFEPVFTEVITEEPVYGEPGPDGVAQVVGSSHKTELIPTDLDLDEFIADMWGKGVRFGIDVEAVAGVISRRETVRMVIARRLEATEGSDAEVEEASDALRRDNSPKRLLNGKADLRRFQNRFPQIGNGARLLKKKKRVLGKPGFKVDGSIIEPPLPADFDLLTLAGEGTRVENQGVNEFIVATREGFLSLDVATNHIAVTEKIENKGGVSLKTTGDLSLAGDEFIEHGEVQEGRVIEGKNMTFRSDVYGDIVSNGGLILLERNLSGGSARSHGGEIKADTRAFNSILEAWAGRISVKYAEGCLIMGESVEIERAVNCEIIAMQVMLGSAEGCGVAGKQVQIAASSTCRDKETIVYMLVPSLLTVDAQIARLRESIGESEKIAKSKEQQLLQIRADEDVARYQALAASIEQVNVKLNPAQQENWNRMTAKFAVTTKVMNTLMAEIQAQLSSEESFRQELAFLIQAREQSGAGIHCQIGEIEGDTLVRSMIVHNGISEFEKLSTAELRIKLREQGFSQERIFIGAEGSLDWLYELPKISE